MYIHMYMAACTLPLTALPPAQTAVGVCNPQWPDGRIDVSHATTSHRQHRVSSALGCTPSEAAFSCPTYSLRWALEDDLGQRCARTPETLSDPAGGGGMHVVYLRVPCLALGPARLGGARSTDASVEHGVYVPCK